MALHISAMSEWDRPGKFVNKSKRDCLLVKDHNGKFVALIQNYLLIPIKDQQIFYALDNPDYLYVQNPMGTWYLVHCASSDMFIGEPVFYISYEDKGSEV